MATMQEELSRDLFHYLVDARYSGPVPRPKRSAWVMNREWYEECARIGGWHGVHARTAQTMLGLSIRVTEDGGFPHLVPD